MEEKVIAKLDEMIQKGEQNKAALEAKFEGQIEGLKSEIKVVKDENDNLKGELTEMKKKNGAIKLQAESQKSFNDVIAEAVEKSHDDIQKYIRKEKSSFGMELGSFNQKAVGDVSTGNVTGGTVWGAQYKPGIITNQNQITHIRQLLTVSSAGPGTDYYFMKENGAGEGAPANVGEKTATAATTAATGLSPQFDVDLIEASVKFETISGFLLASNKSLQNIPGFVAFLQKRVPEKLMDVEDSQILYGNGTSPNIKGIFTSGNFTAGSAAGSTALVEKIINDISAFEDTYKRVANGIVMRPADYWSFFKNKASGSGEYDLPEGVVFVNGVLYIMGIPVAKTTALTTNDYSVGDWNLGAELLVQNGLSLEFFREDGTNVRTNQTTIRIQETIALPVYGSDYFLKGSSATA